VATAPGFPGWPDHCSVIRALLGLASGHDERWGSAVEMSVQTRTADVDPVEMSVQTRTADVDQYGLLR
jgi:hypothetical protein